MKSSTGSASEFPVLRKRRSQPADKPTVPEAPPVPVRLCVVCKADISTRMKGAECCCKKCLNSKHAAMAAEWRRKNPEKQRAIRKRNSAKNTAYTKLWLQENPEKVEQYKLRLKGKRKREAEARKAERKLEKKQSKRQAKIQEREARKRKKEEDKKAEEARKTRTLAEITIEVAERFGLENPDLLFSGERTRPFPMARFCVFDALEKSGWSKEKIAKRFRMNRASVTYGIRIARGEQPKKQSLCRERSAERFRLWALQYRKGWKIYKIAKRSGVDRASVYYGLRKVGAYTPTERAYTRER